MGRGIRVVEPTTPSVPSRKGRTKNVPLCVPTRVLYDVERLTAELTWEAWDGVTPGLAFSGRNAKGFPFSVVPESRTVDDPVYDMCADRTCAKWGCSNGDTDVRISGKVRVTFPAEEPVGP